MLALRSSSSSIIRIYMASHCRLWAPDHGKEACPDSRAVSSSRNTRVSRSSLDAITTYRRATGTIRETRYIYKLLSMQQRLVSDRFRKDIVHFCAFVLCCYIVSFSLGSNKTFKPVCHALERC